MRIHLLTIKLPDATITYRAYASTDPDRSEDDASRDMFWQLGYQPAHPGQSDIREPLTNTRGTLQRYSVRTAELTVEECGDWIRVALDTSGYISTSYPLLAEQGVPESQVGEGYTYTMIPFYAIQPNLEFGNPWPPVDANDSDSDSD